MRLRRLSYFFIGLLFSGVQYAQLPQQMKVTAFDGSMGFYSRVVTSLQKDKKGFVWIGTSDGLYRYDGYTFRSYQSSFADTQSLPANYVSQLALAGDGKLWIGLQKYGVCSFDPASGKIRSYPFRKNGEPFASQVSMLLVDHQQKVWVGLNNEGLWQLNTTSGEYIQINHPDEKALQLSPADGILHNTISAGLVDETGTIWLGAYTGLYQFDPEKRKLTGLLTHSIRTGEFRTNDFISIEKEGNWLWLGAWAGGLTKYNIRTGQWKNYKIDTKETRKFTTNIIGGVRKKSATELWIASNDKGLGVFDIPSESFRFYSSSLKQEAGIPSNLCYRVDTDEAGNLWLIHEWGLSRIQQKQSPFRFVEVPVTKTDNLEYYYIRDRLEDEDHIFLATALADGLHVINKKTGRRYQFNVETLPGEEPFLAVYRLYKDRKGNIWIISRDVIYQYDKRNEKLVKITQPTTAPLTKTSNEFNNICEDKQGHIWITSARNGVFEYLPETGKYHHYYHREGDAGTLASSKLTAVTADAAGRIWMGGPACLAYFEPITGKFVNYTLLNRHNEPVNSILALYTDAKGDIWAGSDAGLVQIDAHSAEPRVIKTYTAQDGLRGEQAYSIRSDRQGNIWCTTPSALCMVNPVTQRVNSLALQQEQIKSITRRLYLSACADSLQLLSYGGYYAFDPLLFQSSRTTASLAITSFRVKEKEYYYEEELKRNGRIHLSASQNLFTFEFGVLDFKNPDDHQYMYQLEGFDKNWLHAGARRYASYTNLPGGDYVFVVKASNSFGDANTPEIRIPLHVDTPFYKTIWFILLVTACIMMLLYGIYKYRLHNERAILRLQTKAQALEKEKTQVQYENLKQHLNPHFLFNSLTSLRSLIRIDQKMAGEFLDGLSRIYRYILQSKDNETVALKDELKFIQTFINLQKTRFRDGLQISIDIPEESDYRKIVPVTLQNLIDNAIKHNIVDEETPLVIEMRVEDEWLVVRNNLQKKSFVDTSNKQGLTSLISLYRYLSDRQVTIEEDDRFFTVKIPLL